MARPDKKQRHKAKRKAKQLASRRQSSISPIKRLAEGKGQIECWMSEDFEKLGQATLFAYKRAAGLSGVACFLVDRGIVGLKDAWSKIGVDSSEFKSMIEFGSSQDITISRCSIEQLRSLVAGGLRWAHQNGMHWPKDWVKTASLIGGVGDWENADLSMFKMEFAGNPEDLRRRLMGQPFDEFIKRTDIDFVLSNNAPVMDLQTGEYDDGGPFGDEEFDDDEFDDEVLDNMLGMSDHFTPAAADLASQTVRWLIDKKQVPSTELLEAWRTLLMSIVFAKLSAPDASNSKASQISKHLFEAFASTIELEEEDQFDLAVEQTNKHLSSDLEMIVRALQKNPPPLLEEE